MRDLCFWKVLLIYCDVRILLESSVIKKGSGAVSALDFDLCVQGYS